MTELGWLARSFQDFVADLGATGIAVNLDRTVSRGHRLLTVEARKGGQVCGGRKGGCSFSKGPRGPFTVLQQTGGLGGDGRVVYPKELH